MSTIQLFEEYEDKIYELEEKIEDLNLTINNLYEDKHKLKEKLKHICKIADEMNIASSEVEKINAIYLEKTSNRLYEILGEEAEDYENISLRG